MGDFKEKHGKTRVGKILSDLGDAGKPILKILSKAPIPGASILGEVAKEIVTSRDIEDGKKEELMAALNMDLKEMENVTERWKSDNTSDNWLSKNARPITLLYLLFLLTVLAVADGAGWLNVKDHWVTLLEALLITVVLAFFGSRGVEKFKKITNK